MTCGSRKYAKRAPAASSRITNSSSSTTRKRSLKRRPSKSCRRITEFCRPQDRKSTRLNSSHSQISYAVFCLKKKKKSDDNRGHTSDIPDHAVQRECDRGFRGRDRPGQSSVSSERQSPRTFVAILLFDSCLEL